MLISQWPSAGVSGSSVTSGGPPCASALPSGRIDAASAAITSFFIMSFPCWEWLTNACALGIRHRGGERQVFFGTLGEGFLPLAAQDEAQELTYGRPQRARAPSWE